MNRLFGRDKERHQLDELLHSHQPEFIAVYGRRRVGKTFLIKEHLRGSITFYASGVIDKDSATQKNAFRQALEECGASTPRGNSWMDLFLSLKQWLKLRIEDDSPCVVFLDEVPCFDTPNSDFIAALDHFWNTWASDYENMKLIVCGSATSWIINNLINSHGGLHNRLTATIHLRPFTLSETENYLKQRGISWNRDSVLQLYMVMGGVPFYLSHVMSKESLPQALDRLYFQDEAPLANEYDRLMASLFRSPEPYYRIVEVLSQHQQGITRDDISKLTGLGTGGNLTRMLTDLENSDFIRSFYTRGHGKKIRVNTCLYQLTDLFTLFHLHFHQKGINDKYFWQNNINTPQINSWQGLAFEKVVMLHIEQIKEALGINRIGVNYYAWRSKTTTPRSQIDLILDRADRLINLCEIKYSQDQYLLSKDEMQRLRLRRQNFVIETGSKQGILLTMITPYGLIENEQYYDIQAQLTMDDLFK